MSETVPHLNAPVASLVKPSGKLPHDQPLPVLRSVQTAPPLGVENPFECGARATPPVQFKAEALKARSAELGLGREPTLLLGWLVLLAALDNRRDRTPRGQLVASERSLAERLGTSWRQLEALLGTLEDAGQLRWEPTASRRRLGRLTIVEDHRLNAHGKGHGYTPVVADKLDDWCRQQELRLSVRLVLLQALTLTDPKHADGYLGETEAQAAGVLGLSRGQGYRLFGPGNPTRGAVAKDEEGHLWVTIYGQMTAYQSRSRARKRDD